MFEKKNGGAETEPSLRRRCGEEQAHSDAVAGTAGLEPTISESKSGVLPLHYVPPYGEGIGITPNPFYHGVGKGTRTLDTRNHNPVL